MKKLDFCVMGFQKSGTTSLFRLLRQHPGIQFYSGKKDPQYFNRVIDWRKHVDEYHSHFSDPSKLWGEASDQYSIFPEHVGTYKRLWEYNPAIKFIAIIRDPVERTLSHYDFNRIRGGAHGKSAEDVILTYAKYCDRSRYYMQIRLFLDYFPKSSFHIVLFDDLVQDSERVAKDMFAFLGVDGNSSIKLHREHRKASVNEAHLKFKYRDLVATNAFHVLRMAAPTSIRRLLKPIFYGKAAAKTFFSTEFKETIWQLLRDDVISLEKEFGIDLTAWKAKYGRPISLDVTVHP